MIDTIYTPLNVSFVMERPNKKPISKLFLSNDLAKEYMYSQCDKFGYQIDKVYNDGIDKTYICSKDNVKFYIHTNI